MSKTNTIYSDIEEINEQCKQRRLKAIRDAGNISGFEAIGNYVVVICPHCENSAAIYHDTADGLPDEICGDCDSCGKEVFVELTWEQTVEIVDVQVRQ